MTNGYVSYKNKHAGIQNPYTCILFVSLHICLLTHEDARGVHAHVFSLWKWMTYVSIPVHVYISFLLKPVCMTAVSLDHLCTLCMRVPVFLLLWSEAAWLDRQWRGVDGELSRNAALCIVCKNKPSGQRYLKRIYIKQLQKQASVCGLVMQRDHTTSLNLITFQEKGNKEIRALTRGPRRCLPQNTKRAATVEGKKKNKKKKPQRSAGVCGGILQQTG